MIWAVVLSIGDEIVTGHVLDTNGAYLAGELSAMGINVVRQVSVPDVHEVIAAELYELGGMGGGGVDVIIATGGLGPTRDDITRYALCEVLGDEMVIDDEALAILEERYARHVNAFAKNNAVQAQRPASARCIDNSFGTAPGLVAQFGRCDVVGGDIGNDGDVNDNGGAIAFFMPGVPREMKEMWVRSVRPAVADRFGEDLDGAGACVRYVQCVSFAESRMGELLGDVMARGENPLVATLPGDSVVKVRVRAWDDDESSGETKAQAMEEEITKRLGIYIFARGKEERTLGEVVQELMIKGGKTVATAESCTAGLLGKMLTERAGSSAFFVGGWLVYTNEMKVKCLGVDSAVIEKNGAVSGECAAALARGAVAKSGSDYGVAITGIAGPGGGSADKPVGTVYVAVAKRGAGEVGVIEKRFCFSGARDQVRHRAAMAGLAMLYFVLSGDEGEGEGDGGGGGKEAGLPAMLWEVGAG